MEKGILFIGPMASQGGPAIKNSILVKHMAKATELKLCNTYDRSLKARLGAVTAILFSRQRYVVVAVSSKGRKLLYPVLLLKKKLSRINYACVVIGGSAVESLKNPLCVRALKNADLVTVETNTLVRQFRETFGLTNLHWMPNYKELLKTMGTSDSEKRFKAPCLHFLFLSSMRDAKGVPTLVRAFKKVLESGYEAELDFFGPVKKDLEPAVLSEIEGTEHMQYCGFADNSKVLETMEQYGVFLFPTEYKGEGFPAVLVEAQAAGLPVIASDINYNTEIIAEDRNGWIFRHGDENALADRIKYSLDNRDELVRISGNNRQDAQKYDAQKVIDAFIVRLREAGWKL